MTSVRCTLLLAGIAGIAGCGNGGSGGHDASSVDGEPGPDSAASPTDGGGADAAPVTYDYDLDGDTVNDTNLAIVECSAAPGTCLTIESALVNAAEVVLAATANTCIGALAGRHLEVIGDYAGDTVHEVAAAHCRHDGVNAPPALAVVDPSAAIVVAETVAPLVQTTAFLDYPRDPQGRRHPFLAPSYGDGLNPAGNWGYLCIYRPGLGGGAPCGAGFVSVDTAPNGGNYFREVGGYLQDLDGDGWDDITLIYHKLVHTVSPATATIINALEYDVAVATEPTAPAWFHSGRNYGTHAAVTGSDGKQRAVVVGGAPVGTFSDYNCNVSRFVAMLDTTAGAPGTRTLRWSRYYGFASTIFSAYDAQYASDPSVVVARPADIMDDCIHRFSDSRSVMDGEEIVIFNYFDQHSAVDVCLALQYDLYLPPQWTPEKADAWYSCFAQNVGATGVWGMQVLRESDGAGLTGSQHTYVWGRSDSLLPGDEIVYLVELLPGSGRFDLDDREESALAVYALVDGMWQQRATFPAVGRPSVYAEPPAGSRGAGSYSYYAELVAQDRDGDGLDEIRIESGAWIGYSTATADLIVK